MKLFGHLGWKLGALALTGGTAAMLFGSTGVSTDFTAVTSGNISASGAFVNVASTGGTFAVSNLIPGGPASPVHDMVFTNKGSVPEAFNFVIGTIVTNATGFDFSGSSIKTGSVDPLTQMEMVISANDAQTYQDLTGQSGSGMTFPVQLATVPLSRVTSAGSVTFNQDSTTGKVSISGIPPQHLTTVPVGGAVSIGVQFELAADGGPFTPPNSVTGGVGMYGNDWMNASVSIPYMLQAQAGGNEHNPSGFEPSLVVTPTVN